MGDLEVTYALHL